MALGDKLIKASSLKIVYDDLLKKIKGATPSDYEQVKEQVNQNADDITEFAGNVVSISDQKPASKYNRFWVKRDKRQIEVPEMREFNELSNTVGTKVDKIPGKALSTNDYTNEAKAKVDAIPADPKYTDTIYDDTEIVKDVGKLKEDLIDIKEEFNSAFYADGDTVSGAVTTGYSLVASPKGACKINSGYRMKKHLVTAGTLIHIVASADTEVTYQFQVGASVPYTENTNLVGEPVSGAVNAYVTVPDGATYLILSESVSNTTNRVNYAVKKSSDSVEKTQGEENAGKVLIVGSDGKVTLGGKMSDKADMSSLDTINEQLYDVGTIRYRNAEANGWKINPTGLSARDASYKIDKYAVVSGTLIYIDLTNCVYQFQSNSNASSTSTEAIIGETHTEDKKDIVAVPVGATYLMVSHAIADTNDKVADVVGKIDYCYDILHGDSLPDYYYQNQYIQGKVERINALCKQNAMHGDAFIFITDAHWTVNAKQSPKIIKYLYENTHVKKLFDGGDTADRGSEEYGNLIAKSFGGEIHHVMGNHDYMGDTTESDLFYWFDMGKSNQIGKSERHYYYVDNEQQKIRYVILSAYMDDNSQTSGYKQGFEAEQLAWLTDTALNVENGWGIIIITHILKSATFNKSDWCAAIDNYNGNGEIIAVIEGHTHYDWLGATDGGIPIFASQSDKNTPYSTEEPWLDDRTTGTTKEQCLQAVIVNRETRKINIVRIGCPIRYGMNPAQWTEQEEIEISY